MRGKRATGRFYVFIGLLMIGGYFILREFLPDTVREALVQSGSTNFNQMVDAVIVRNEVVSSYEGNGRVVYVADEGQQVAEGDEICEVYPAGYSERELERLESVRQSIRSYHEQILDNIVDKELDLLEKKVEDTAFELKTLIGSKAGGSLLNLQKQLEEAMQQRQDYLRQNQRQDYRLNDLYDQEAKRMNAIASWRTTASSPCAGIVSFYLDGYEQYLNVDTLEQITPAQILSVLAGRSLAEDSGSRLTTNIFRVVSTDKWYIVLLSQDQNWNPTSEQNYTFQMEGYPDVAYTGKIISMQKSEGQAMAILEVQGTPGPLINVRCGKANLGAYLSGLTVPVAALTEEAGQTGVWLEDAAGATFVPVEILSKDNKNALVQPLMEGTLSVGQRILIQ